MTKYECETVMSLTRKNVKQNQTAAIEGELLVNVPCCVLEGDP
jgi:hypothetical protein